MKRIFVLGLAALFAVSCSKSNTAVVNATINGAAQKDIIVSQLAVTQLKVVDTIKTNGNGVLKGKISVEQTPNFYYLSYNGKKLASLILKAGDNVTITVDTLGKNLAIEGSAESSLLMEYDQMLATSMAKMEALTAKMSDAEKANDMKLAQQYNAELGKVYVQHKQGVIKNIMKNPYAFANIQALHQSFAQVLPVFGDANDFLLVQRVHDSLQTVYPNSVYVKSLKEQLEAANKVQEMAIKVSEASQVSFPNIILPDVNAKNIELASLEGKPFILMFWSSEDANQKMFNNDLMDIYNKYKAKGFEIYQVSVDTDKTAWATAVKEQNLPWISVCDGKGAASPAVAAYNVATIPSVFVFDKNGDIILSQRYAITKAEILKAVEKAVK